MRHRLPPRVAEAAAVRIQPFVSRGGTGGRQGGDRWETDANPSQVGGCEAYEEDRWKRVRIGGLTFRVVKGCACCRVCATDQRTGEVAATKGADGVTPEPLATMEEYREKGAKGRTA